MSLLTAYFIILNTEFQPVAELDLKIRPDKSEPYIVTAEAIGINGIDLVQHNKDAVTEAAAADELRSFLRKYKPEGREKLIPVGHNIPFDIGFIERHLVSRQQWSEFCEHRVVDTCVVANFLRLAGKLHVRSVSLDTLVSHFNLPRVQSHNAKNDTLQTVLVLKELWKLVGGGQ
jgi:DNA polymerase III epsilon subunit-like protein